MVVKKNFKPGIWEQVEGLITPIRVMFAFAAFVAGCTWKVSDKLNTVMWKLESVEAQTKAAWTRNQQREFYHTVWRDNPTLRMDNASPDAIATRIP